MIENETLLNSALAIFIGIILALPVILSDLFSRKTTRTVLRIFHPKLIFYMFNVLLLILYSKTGISLFFMFLGFIFLQTLYSKYKSKPLPNITQFSIIILLIASLVGILGEPGSHEEVMVGYLYGLSLGILFPLLAGSALTLIPTTFHPLLFIFNLFIFALTSAFLFLIISSVSLKIGFGTIFLVILSLFVGMGDVFANLVKIFKRKKERRGR